MSGSVGSVTGSVGSVVGNVGGNVVGSVGSVVGNVGGNVVGNVNGSVGSVAAGGITATSIATGAIDADALATDAVNEIADGVWDEAIAGHLTAGSTGEALNNAAAGGATPAAIADAVWDELRAGHVIAGSFGEGVASVQGNVTGSAGSVVGSVGGNVVGSVGSIAAGGLTAASTDATFTTEIEDTVWDATIANHLDPGSTGEALDNASTGGGGTDWTGGERDQIRQALGITGTTAATTGTGTLEVGIAGVQSDTNDIQTRLPATLSGGRMRSQVEGMDAGTITAAVVATDAIDADALATSAVNEIVDQVWDEAIAGHLAVGTHRRSPEQCRQRGQCCGHC